MSKRNVALVGIGYWGKNLARNLNELGALHTICDSNESMLDKYEGTYPEVRFTSNYGSILENPEIKRLVIAAPAPAHYSVAKQALQAGKDVYVEKPLCLNCGEAEELIQLAEERGRILMVGHLLQYHPCVRTLQEMLTSGELGKLQYVVSNRLNLGKVRTEENALWNFAPHDVSVILSLCGNQLPEQVRCFGAAYLSEGVVDTSMTTLRFAGGVRAHIYVSWLHPFKEQKLVVVGSKGMVVFDDTKEWEEKLVLYRDHVTWTDGNVPLVEARDGERVSVPRSEPLRNECEHFLNSCERRVAPKTDGAEGLRVLKVLQAAQASLDADSGAMDPGAGTEPVSTYFVHPSAVVDSGAEIGIGSKVWHFSHVMKDAKVGPSCNIGQNVVVSPGVTLGRNVKVQNNVSLYTGVVCEDDVFIGPSAVFTNVLNPRAEVVRRGQYQTTTVRKGASIGANATIVCGTDLGEYSFVGAGAVVTRDIPAYGLVLGNPAKQVGWMSRHGDKLDLPVSVSDDSMEATCPSTGHQYRLEGAQLIFCGEAKQEQRLKPELATVG